MLGAMPGHDDRPTRKVVKYVDEAALAIDELECGHRHVCSRRPGGRVVVPHNEPCTDCYVDAERARAADGAASPVRGSGVVADGARGMERGR